MNCNLGKILHNGRENYSPSIKTERICHVTGNWHKVLAQVDQQELSRFGRLINLSRHTKHDCQEKLSAMQLRGDIQAR